MENTIKIHKSSICSINDIKLKEGHFFDFTSNWTVIDLDKYPYPTDTIEIYDQLTNNPLALLKRNAIPLDLCDLAVSSFLDIAKNQSSTRRGMAAGHVKEYISTKYNKTAPVNTSVLGYFDSANGKKPCRLTKLSQDEYCNSFPFIKSIDECFKELCPEAYQKQYDAVSTTAYQIENTAYSTITINYNFRTALHVDKGDYKDGFGNLVICSKNIDGGYLLFPRYEVAIQLNTGDFLAMNVHEYHCNSPINYKNNNETNFAYRLAIITYFRQSLRNCKPSVLPENYNTEMVMRDIFKCIHQELPVKQSISENGWWIRETDRFRLTYKGRKYFLEDKIMNKKISSLKDSYVYAKSL